LILRARNEQLELTAGLNPVHGRFLRLGNFLLQSKVSQVTARLLETPETAQQFVRMQFATSPAPNTSVGIKVKMIKATD
jgi:hypothetical protein